MSPLKGKVTIIFSRTSRIFASKVKNMNTRSSATSMTIGFGILFTLLIVRWAHDSFGKEAALVAFLGGIFVVVALTSWIGPLEGRTERLNLLIKEATGGNVEAQLELGWRYIRGEGASRDLVAAFKWLSLSAAKGNADAQFLLAGFYKDGIGGIVQNYAEAWFWCALALKNGISESAKDEADAAFKEIGHHLSDAEKLELGMRVTQWAPSQQIEKSAIL